MKEKTDPEIPAKRKGASLAALIESEKPADQKPVEKPADQKPGENGEGK